MMFQEPKRIDSYIKEYFSKDMMKKLYLIAMNNRDYRNNNEKADDILKLLGSNFLELGPGTNRVVVKRDKVVFKLAMDRRGMVDNFTEFKRSPEVPQYCAKTYESNIMIIVSEYVNLMDEQDYLANREPILKVLSELDKDYIFEDMGYSMVNRCNTGYRDNGDIVFLDYGYMYPKVGNEDALICRACGDILKHNSTYTNYVCPNPACKATYDFASIRRRMTLDLENEEDKLISGINRLKAPDWNNLAVQAYMNRLFE